MATRARTGKSTRTALAGVRRERPDARLALLERAYSQALARQAATAEILKVLARSPADVQPVFHAIARSAHKLLNARYAVVTRRVGDTLHLAAHTATTGIRHLEKLFPTKLTGQGAIGKAVLTREPAWIADVETDPDYSEAFRAGARERGYRSQLTVPILRDGESIGAITVTRAQKGRFARPEIGLLQTFADQAAIAIENVRLFKETKEALERQTASGEILSVIAGARSDARPVFEAILSSALRLFSGTSVAISLMRGAELRIVAADGAFGAMPVGYVVPLGSESTTGRAILERRTVSVPDADAADASQHTRDNARRVGFRAVTSTPLLFGGKAIGCITVMQKEPGGLSEQQLGLLRTFADQAVIAIQNVRLFNELEARNKDLGESLQQQTATAEILKVISASPTDTKPVFDAIAESAARIFAPASVAITMREGRLIHLRAIAGPQTPEGERSKVAALYPMSFDLGVPSARCMDAKQVIHVSDTEAPGDAYDSDAAERIKAVARAAGYRSFVMVPMIKGDIGIGAVALSHPAQGFAPTAKQLSLMRAFADQAVIAIENVRLFNETKEALARQTATADILRVISRSPADVHPVFHAIVGTAHGLLSCQRVAILLRNADHFDAVAWFDERPGARTPMTSAIKAVPIDPADNFPSRVFVEKRMLHLPDWSNIELTAHERRIQEQHGWRASLMVPLIRDEICFGVLTFLRSSPVAFTDSEIALGQSFADQAVIAIENTRLFNETKEALERETASAEILRVISSTPTDTQPVFDAIVRSAQNLLDGKSAVLLLRREADFYVAGYSAPGFGELPAEVRVAPLDRAKNFPSQVMLDRKVVHIPDWEADDVIEFERFVARSYGIGSGVQVPLLRQGVGIGALAVTRATKGPFQEKEIALLQSFADQAVIAIENVRLFNETKEALERQTATSEILSVISRSPSDLVPVFDAILEGATKLCGAHLGVLNLYDGEVFTTVAQRGGDPQFVRWLFDRGTFPPTYTLARLVETRQPVAITDMKDSVAYRDRAGNAVGFVELAQARSYAGVPLVKEDRVLGMIAIYRPEVRPFTDKQIDLVKTFASQAVIAIDNVRLFNETKEALDQQTATSEILGVISSTPTDTQPVFDAIVKSGLRIFGGSSVAILLADADRVWLASAGGFIDLESARKRYPLPLDRNTISGRTIMDKVAVNIGDVRDVSAPELARGLAQELGYRAIASAPMLREGVAIGALTVTRQGAGALSEKEMALLRTFADQAVIAIENARLFNETREALEQQTATAEILSVISSTPTDTQPVFDAIVKSGLKVFSGNGLAIALLHGEEVRVAAGGGWVDDASVRKVVMPLSRDSASGTAILEARVINIGDTEGPDAPPYARENGRAFGYRSMAVAPMIRDGLAIGVISVMRRSPGGLDDKQLRLLKTFADQAVIAIENVRLFKELETRNAHLTETLEQQTATGEILKVISASHTDVQPVFETIIRNATRLCNGTRGTMFTYDGQMMDIGAHYYEEEAAGLTALFRSGYPVPANGESPSGQAIAERRIVNVADILAADYSEAVRERARVGGYRAVLTIPLMRGAAPVGALAVARAEPGEFSESYVSLLQTFADQAIIAIENVRLFKELQARTEALSQSVQQLTALGEVGRTISSTLDLQAVLETIVAHAVKLTGLDGGTIYEYEERSQDFHLRAGENMPDEMIEVYRAMPIRLGEGIVGTAATTRQPVQVPDIRDQHYQTRYKELLLRQGYRAILAVPLLRDEQIVGAITVSRSRPGAFPPEVVELLKTFAAQSALAIQNARLFREIEEKSRQLEDASRHKSQFLASMSHELRTPLNAILGFNEMILGGIYGDVPADMGEPLKDMQTSGRHLLRLINNVLDLAKIEAGRMELALADYSVHDTVTGVQATLRPLAADKGLDFVVSVQEDIPLARGDAGRLTQCLMNLAGNSLKFTRQGKVSISVLHENGLLRYCVSDTGIGIAPDKIASLFTEFKQTDATIASEYGGTGLGLSITKKFVEMHGGRIWVESTMGRDSQFIFEIPLRVGQ